MQKKSLNLALFILALLCASQTNLSAQPQPAAPVSVAPTQENLIFYTLTATPNHFIKMIRHYTNSPSTTETVAQVQTADILAFKAVKTVINNTPHVTLVYRVVNTTSDRVVIKRFNGDNPAGAQVISRPVNLLLNMTTTPPLESLAVAQDINNHLFILVSGLRTFTLLEYDANLNFVTSNLIDLQLPSGQSISRVKMKIDPISVQKIYLAYHLRILNSTTLNFLIYDRATNSITTRETIQTLATYFDKLSFFVDLVYEDALTTFQGPMGRHLMKRTLGQWNNVAVLPISEEAMSANFVLAYQRSFFMTAYLPGVGGLPGSLFFTSSNDTGNSFSNLRLVGSLPNNLSLQSVSFIEDENPLNISLTSPDILTYGYLPLGQKAFYIHKLTSNGYSQTLVRTFGSTDYISAPMGIPFP